MFYLLLIFTAIYLLFSLFIISGLFRHNTLPISNSGTLPFVSVIIAARNEEDNIPSLIDDLINQEYPLGKFEIIIVNDRSSDSTQNILIEASENYSFIKNIKIDKKSKEMTPKKHAIDIGIKESKGEIILATDADCRVGSLWVASMTYSLINKNGIIIGYSEIDDKKRNFFEKYQKIDFLAIFDWIHSSFNSFGSREKLESGPPSSLERVTCFSIAKAPNDIDEMEDVIPIV